MKLLVKRVVSPFVHQRSAKRLCYTLIREPESLPADDRVRWGGEMGEGWGVSCPPVCSENRVDLSWLVHV